MQPQDHSPIRVLAISPYESMTVSLTQAAEAFPRLQVKAYTGDLQAGVDIVQELDLSHFDVLISRGGTAEMLRPVTDLPVVEIPISLYDVLRAIKLAENYTRQSAIIGFPGITENAHVLCNLLRLDIPIETVHHQNQIHAVLSRLKEKNIHTVICDMVSHGSARNEGFQAMLITSSEHSLHQALQDAETQGGTFRRLRYENLFLRSLLSMDSRRTVVFNSQRKKVFSLSDTLSEELLTALRRRIPTVPEKGEQLFYLYTENSSHMVTASCFQIQGEKNYLFRDQPTQIPLRTPHNGIRSYDAPECEQLFNNSFFTISACMGDLEQRLSPIAASGHPVMIIGEGGTGKEQIARALYLRSRLKHHPFIAVDGARLNDRSWEYLLEHYNSPMSLENTAIFFRHMEDAPPHRQKALLSLIEETGLTRRLWLIFSCNSQEGEAMSSFARELSLHLAPLSLNLPTLRSRKDEIPALASLYLSNLNMELGKQIAGFEPEALNTMIRYDWPGNYTQFKHVLHELSILTASAYISAVDVADLLARERQVYRRISAPTISMDMGSGTLDDITRGIVRQALRNNNGNQSLTARQLGISRTTLWRMISQGGDRRVP